MMAKNIMILRDKFRILIAVFLTFFFSAYTGSFASLPVSMAPGIDYFEPGRHTVPENKSAKLALGAVKAPGYADFKMGQADVPLSMTGVNSIPLFSNIPLCIGFGAILVILIQYLIFFLIIRERTYIYYVFYIIAQVGILLTMDGYSIGRFLPGGMQSQSGYYPEILSWLLIPVFFFRFDFLRLKKALPRVHIACITVIILFFLTGFLGLILEDYIAIPVVHTVTIAVWIFSLAVSVLRLKQGFGAAKFLLAGGIMLFLGYGMYIFMYAGILPVHWFFRYFIKIGFLAESMMMFYGTAARINYIKRGKAAAQEEAIRNLEKAERIKDEFLSNMTHELKTPIHGIIGLAESMQPGKSVQPEDSGKPGLIATSGRYLMKLIDDILDYSRMKSGNPEIVKKPFDIAVTAQNAIDILNPLTAGKSLTLVNCIRKGLPPAYADENRIGRVLQNLVSNAIKFTQAGRVEISASLAEGNDMLTVTVTNTGIGMPADIREKIFFSFDQADGSIAQEYGGTGLVLAICKRIIELHGGRIWLEPAPNNGSSFAFTIPVSAHGIEPVHNPGIPHKKAAALYQGAPGPEENEAPEPILGNPSILIVDDDPVNISVLHHHLSMQECSLTIATDGMKAFYMIEDMQKKRNEGERFFDLVLLDMMMPRVSGLDVLKRIRMKLSAEELPVILLTARSDKSDIDLSFDYGANDYIMKPFSVRELFKRINYVLTSRNIPPDDVFKLTDRGNEYHFKAGDVLYLSANGKHTVVHTLGRDYDLTVLLKDIESSLPAGFIRVHRKFIVNTSHIAKVSHYSGGRYTVLLDDSDDTMLVASRSVLSALRDIMEKKNK